MSSILETAPDAMVIVNQAGEIALVNSEAERMFGYPRAEILGQVVDVLVPVRFRDHHLMHRAGYFSDPKLRPMGMGYNLFGLRQDGTEFPVEISLSPLQTTAGILVTAAIRDVTERKRVEQTLQEKNVELEKAIQAKDHFLASMSHELRTPLNAIIGFTGTLLMRLPGPLTSDQEKQLRTIQGSARHLLSLINDLLDLAKIESGKVEVNLQPVVAQEVMEEVATVLRPLAEQKGLHFELEMPRQKLVVMTDRRALSQVLINLTNNAIKFTEKGGIHLALARVQSDGHLVTELSVTDTGIGIQSEDQAKLFAAFQQVKGSRHHSEGTGLGLHLSKKLAALMGGYIDFSSEYGKGSRFALIIPDT